MANNNPNSFNKYTLSTKDTVPASTTGTGTIAVTGTEVVGTGTLFTTELRQGDFLVSFAQDEIREVIRISTDLYMHLNAPFTANIAAGATPIYVKASRFSEIAWKNTGGVVANVDGAPVNPGIAEFAKINDGDRRRFVDPIIVDGATSTFEIQTTV